MLLDIHTHRNAAVPGECIFNVEPAWFEPVEGGYYSVGIHPWKVLEAGPEDWTTLEKAVCHHTTQVADMQRISRRVNTQISCHLFFSQ